MTRRGPKRSPQPEAAVPQPSAGGMPRWVAFLFLLMASGVMAAVVFALARRTLSSLPALAIGPKFETVYYQAGEIFNSSGGDLRAGWEHDQIARMIGRALIDASNLRKLREPGEFAAIGRERGKSRVGVMFQLTILMAALERQGEPVEKWRPLLFPYFDKLKGADFTLFWTDVRDAWRRAFVMHGLRPGMARLGAATLWLPYGPPLEFFVSRGLAYADALAADAETRAEADTVRRVVLTVLRQWTLGPGPVELRLLASDLLADALENDEIAAAAEAPLSAVERATLIENLRAFRKAYIDNARRRIKWLMRIDDRPQLLPDAENRIGWYAGLGIWTVSGLAVSIVAQVLLAFAFIGRGGAALRLSSLWRYSAMFSVGVVIVGIVVMLAGWEWVVADLKAMRLQVVFAAIGAAIVLLVLTCFAASSVGGSVLARLSAIGGQASVFLAVACIVICLLTDAAISRYDRGLAQGPNDYTMVTGTDGETHLAALRAWRP